MRLFHAVVMDLFTRDYTVRSAINHLKTVKSCAAFYSKSTKDIKHALVDAEVIQGWVHADIDRMLQRAHTRGRHPGHADWYEGYEKECRDKDAQGAYNALDIGGVTVAIDSNDFESQDYKNAVDQLVEHYRI